MLHTGNCRVASERECCTSSACWKAKRGHWSLTGSCAWPPWWGWCCIFTRRVELTRQLLWIKLTLFAYFVYNVLSGFWGTLHSEWFMHTWSSWLSFVFEILIYSSFYLLSGDPRADIYFFYFIPLFFAVHFLSAFPALAVIAFEGMNLYGVVLHLTACRSQGRTGFRWQGPGLDLLAAIYPAAGHEPGLRYPPTDPPGAGIAGRKHGLQEPVRIFGERGLYSRQRNVVGT